MMKIGQQYYICQKRAGVAKGDTQSKDMEGGKSNILGHNITESDIFGFKYKTEIMAMLWQS